MRLASLFSDHAVVQRDRAVPVWGWTGPRRLVVVALGLSRAVAVSDEDGRFDCRLPPQPAGGPYVLTATVLGENGTPEAAARADDVHVGEVWLASGQSNMAMTVEATGVRPAACPAVRMFTVPRRAEAGCAREVGAVWETATPAAASGFSAVAYHFAAKLWRELGVAVGILHASWGGTRIEAWTSRATLARNPDMRERLDRYDAELNAPERWPVIPGEKGLAWLKAAPNAYWGRQCPRDPGNEGVGRGWAEPEFDDSRWPAMTLPGVWTRQGHPIGGVFWFRRTVAVDASMAGRDHDLLLGGVDKHDVAYWNGEEIGRTGTGFDTTVWNQPRHYRVPGRLVRAGANVVAVRVYSFAYDGGLVGPRLGLAPAGGGEGAFVDLAGPWRYAVEHDFGPMAAPPDGGSLPGPGSPNSPHILFDQMIRPLIPYALRGAIWYQGEADVDAAARYRRHVVDLARDWRFHWMQGDFPFIQVQLANYTAVSEYDGQAAWPRLREAQWLATKARGIGMVSAIDLGEADDIHPKNKRAVGERLAGWALARTYGRAGHAAHGPHYAGFAVEGRRIRLRFTGLEGGLAIRGGGSLRGFVMADAGRRFRTATARIDGDDVVVECPGMERPAAVRYAWSDNPGSANLVNRAGLPASGFRTDSWE